MIDNMAAKIISSKIGNIHPSNAPAEIYPITKRILNTNQLQR